MTRTTNKTIRRGPVLRAGTVAAYHALELGPGEPIRDELGQRVSRGDEQSVAYLAHVSDLHLTDVESPARLDFFIDAADDPRHEQVLPVARPQQLTSVHASIAALHSVDQLPPSEQSSRMIDVAIFTGDLIDNAQQNEMDKLTTAIQGGALTPFASAETITGVQTDSWQEGQVWRPSDSQNKWVTDFGFPTDPNLIGRIASEVQSTGLTTPAYLVRGNHDGLLAGTVAWTAAARELAEGSEKVRGLPDDQLLEDPAKSFREHPDEFMAGYRVPTAYTSGRVPLLSDDFPLATPSSPEPRRLDQRASYVIDITDRVRLVAIDTVDDAGHPDGVFSRESLAWLAEVLDESSDRLVLIASHHGPFDHHPPASPGAVRGEEMVSLLLQHQNVVAWMCGHTHFARTRLHADDGSRGFWEITAPSIIDWPCQFTTVEIFESSNGSVRIDVVLQDLDVPIRPGDQGGWKDIASLHRELCANQADFGGIFPGHDILDTRNRSLALGPLH